MSAGFKDHFSGHAPDYARYRPVYPPELFAWLARRSPGTGRAWDCATGSGQAAVALAKHFDEVVATDASARQIDSATATPGIRYAVAGAEASGLAANTCDLVTVAQAAHWFDLPAFYAEARRVAVPGGLVALWTYAFVDVPGPAGEVIVRYGKGRVGSYWPPERALVETGYRTLPFPFDELEVPDFAMRVHWSLEDLMGYVGTWSATRRYTQATGVDPLPELAAELAPHWPDPQRPRTIRWPLHFRAGYVTQ